MCTGDFSIWLAVYGADFLSQPQKLGLISALRRQGRISGGAQAHVDS